MFSAATLWDAFLQPVCFGACETETRGAFKVCGGIGRETIAPPEFSLSFSFWFLVRHKKPTG